MIFKFRYDHRWGRDSSWSSKIFVGYGTDENISFDDACSKAEFWMRDLQPYPEAKIAHITLCDTQVIIRAGERVVQTTIFLDFYRP